MKDQDAPYGYFVVNAKWDGEAQPDAVFFKGLKTTSQELYY